ncbi:hypothetical protein [Haloarcula nitratireducens]|uniref:Uncharacterized protein n=1 Tax=Haloarcula nitratireducens TaxID=2487749 RepID=A0AAW4PFQ5_9EURY|nr:hypothetical protein [Halomicroarcula nitratireducens]MBX0297246.1 hypothetical protein [Halomicroarcula nitratireducens]
MVLILLQIRATGSEPAIALAVLAVSVLAIVLSLTIALVLIRGYRQGPGHRGMLWLAVGLLLLTTIPELLRIGLPTATGIDTLGRSLLVSGCELLGLGIILWAIYRGGTY